jgi:hypothetical protein
MEEKMTYDSKRMLGIVSAEVIEAMRIADSELASRDIPHFVIGGLAVCAYGYRRTTNDVDFIVSDSAYNRIGPIVTLRVPITSIGGVKIDQLSFEAESELHAELEATYKSGQTGQIAPLPMLMKLKLIANRQKDIADVVELIKCGAVDDDKYDTIEQYLSRSDLVRRWRCAIARARKESQTP